MSVHSPLEQFELSLLIPIRLGNFNIPFTNSSLFMLLSCGLVVALISLSTKNATLIPSRWQSVTEMLYDFVGNLISENIGKEGVKYFPLIFCLFTFLLFCNLLGMIPYSFTVTSHLIVTFGLGCSLFIGTTIIGFQKHGLHFFSMLLPEGCPGWLAPALVVIELISYVSKPLSLSIRLFANMMAGHTLLKIIAGFGWSLFALGGLASLGGFVPVILLIALMGLEFGVAMVQAYVFTLLFCTFLNDSIHLH